MHPIKQFIYITIFILSISISSNSFAEPKMTYNNAGTFNLSFSDSGIENQPLDWWFVMIYTTATVFLILYLNSNFEVKMANSIEEVKPAAQINATDFTNFPVMPVYNFQPGNYDVYYGVDFNQNGQLDLDSAVYVSTRITF